MPAQARADLIDVQFGSGNSTQFSGAALVGHAGDQWNYFRSASGSSSLTDSSGLSSGISITYSAQGTYGITPSSDSGFYGTAYLNLMQSFLYTYTSVTLTLTGLSPGRHSTCISTGRATRTAATTAVR